MQIFLMAQFVLLSLNTWQRRLPE